jgi:hypothetical protein
MVFHFILGSSVKNSVQVVYITGLEEIECERCGKTLPKGSFHHQLVRRVGPDRGFVHNTTHVLLIMI